VDVNGPARPGKKNKYGAIRRDYSTGNWPVLSDGIAFDFSPPVVQEVVLGRRFYFRFGKDRARHKGHQLSFRKNLARKVTQKPRAGANRPGSWPG